MKRAAPRPAAGRVLETTMRNRLSEIARVADLVEAFGERHGLARPLVHDLQVCLDEILSNIVRYAFTDEAAHEIGVRVTLGTGELVIEVTDDGRPFDPVLFTAPPVPASARRRKPGGVGIYFVRRLMDELVYRREGSTNRLVAKKNIAVSH